MTGGKDTNVEVPRVEEGSISRRTLVLGGALVVAAGLGGGGAVVGPKVFRRLKRESVGKSVPIPSATSTTKFLSMSSKARGKTVNVGVVVPGPLATGQPVPVCVWLHGKGDSAKTVINKLKVGHFLKRAVDDGIAPFAVVAIDGGNSYWHRRRSGEDAEAMVINELPEFLAANGLEASTWAIAGWSMGGYGSLLLAERHPKFVAVAASSAAVWFKGGDTRAGAFDSAEDFAAHDVLKSLGKLPAHVRIDCGNDDPFASTSAAMLQRIPGVEGGLGAGAHTMRFWRSVLPEQLEFLGKALST